MLFVNQLLNFSLSKIFQSILVVTSSQVIINKNRFCCFQVNKSTIFKYCDSITIYVNKLVLITELKCIRVQEQNGQYANYLLYYVIPDKNCTNDIHIFLLK